MATWRQHFRPYIQKIILENQGKTEKETRRILREAKPADARSYGSVNAVWLDEVKKQLSAIYPAPALPGSNSPQDKEPAGQTALDFG